MKIFLYIFLVIFSLEARLINYSIATVDEKIITAYDTKALATKLNISEKEALDVLIEEKIKDIQIERLNLGVNEYDFNSQVVKLGLKDKEKIQALKNKLNEERFFNFILDNARINTDPSILRDYYELNKARFTSFKSLDLALYSSKDKEILKKALEDASFKHKDLKIKHISLNKEEINPSLLDLFNQSKEKSFTNIFKGPNGYISYYIKAKNQAFTPSFEELKEEVKRAFLRKQESLYLQNYLDKLKAKANIVIIKE